MLTATRRAGFSGAALALLALLPGLIAADAEDSDGLRRRAREVVSSERYQTTLRFDAADPSAESLAAERSARSARDDGGFRLEPGVLGDVATLLLYMISAVVIVLLVVWIVRVLGERSQLGELSSPRPARRGLEKRRGGVESATASGESVDYLREVDRLAASGRYDEAVHLILLGAIQHLDRTGSFVGKDSFTSREIAAELRVDEPRKGAFRDLVLAVEESLFRGLPVTEAHLERCRAQLEMVRGGESA